MRAGFNYSKNTGDGLTVNDAAAIRDSAMVDQRSFSDGNRLNDVPALIDRGGGEDFFLLDRSVMPDSLRRDMKLMPDLGIIPAQWITIKAGTFYMGSPEDELCRQSNETQHQVTLTHDFEIQSTEVTVGQFWLLWDPSMLSSRTDLNSPATINWEKAANICNLLSASQGLTPCYDCKQIEVPLTCSTSGFFLFCDEFPQYLGSNIYQCPGYRLPTEAEWEYAYRSGSSSAFYNGSISECNSHDSNADAIAWYETNANNKVHQGGQKQPNAWGLYDMAGNLAEWANDYYQEDLGTASVTDPGGPESGIKLEPCNRPNRGLRGGSYIAPSSQIRAAARGSSNTTIGGEELGFRCVRTLP